MHSLITSQSSRYRRDLSNLRNFIAKFRKDGQGPIGPDQNVIRCPVTSLMGVISRERTISLRNFIQNKHRDSQPRTDQVADTETRRREFGLKIYAFFGP